MRVPKRFSQWLVVASAIVVSTNQRAAAQEALRSALESDAAARLRDRPAERPPDDVLRWGPVTFDVSLGYSLEASDNIIFSRSNRESDLIQRPNLNVGLVYQASRQSRLNAAIGFGYEDYINNSRFDRFVITPGSEVAFDVRVGDAVVTLFDRFDYSQDVANEGALSGVARFPQLQNTVGLRSVWKVDQWLLQAGYSHLNVFVTEDETSTGTGQRDFNYLERADEQFFGRVGYAFDVPVQAGIEATGSLSDYASELQHDRHTISAGPYVTWTAANALEIALRGGVAYTSFYPTDSLAEGTEYTSFYAGFDLNHRLTDYITYGFSVTHDVRPGINLGSDYIETTEADLNVAWNMTRFLTVSGRVFGEMSEEVGLEGASRSTQKYKRAGAEAGSAYQLTGRLSLFARYAFVAKDSEDELLNYTENRVTVGGNYRF